MNFGKSECFYCKGEIRGVKCISEIQQWKNRKVQGSSTQWFYFVSLGSEREHWAEKLGEMTGRGGLVGEACVEAMGGETFSKRLGFERIGNERNTREGQHRVFV